MKFILRLLLILPFIAFSQTVTVNGTVKSSEDEFGFPGVMVTLLQNDTIFQEVQTNIDGRYTLNNINPGVYDLKISPFGLKDKTILNFEIYNNLNQIDFALPEPCVPVKRKCPEGHTNNIIPIVYGFPTEKMMRKAKNGKVKLGGCNTTFCEKWHCKTHEIDF